jgi:hypothetical protein
LPCWRRIAPALCAIGQGDETFDGINLEGGIIVLMLSLSKHAHCRSRYVPSNIRSASLAMLFALLAAGCASSPTGEPPPPQWHPPSEMLEKYADANGVVTRAAMEGGLRADFAAADRNRTGCLDADEVRAINEARWQADASTASPLIDFRHNGCIDFGEFAATPRSLFDQLDKNGDGRLTPKELHPRRRPQS